MDDNKAVLFQIKTKVLLKGHILFKTQQSLSLFHSLEIRNTVEFDLPMIQV